MKEVNDLMKMNINLILAVTMISHYLQENDQPVNMLQITIDYRLLEESSQWDSPRLTLFTMH